MPPEEQHHQHLIPITIDGRPHAVEQGRHLTAAQLLRLAGLDPAGYDLARLTGHGEVHKFADDDLVDVHAGERFVSVRQNAPVA
jgi:hypothetical protein